jgi:polysaccharide export outer membrane protein
MNKFRCVAEVCAVGLLLCLSAVCRSADVPTTGEQTHSSPLSPGDAVSIQVIGQPDATNASVSDDGTINVPLVGNVKVSGMSPVEAADRIAKALKDGGYYVDPHVTVVTQPRGQLVSVMGEVHTTGRFPLGPRTTILDLLAQAGGVKETASDVGYVLRSDDSGHVSRLPVKLDGLTDMKSPLPAVTLLAGDTLIVPPAGHYFVTGEVTMPGKFFIEPGLTIMQAIVHAGGVTERGSESRIELKRVDKTGQYRVVHAKPGDLVQSDDIIRVKESIF